MSQQLVELYAGWDADLSGLRTAPVGVLAACGRLWKAVLREDFDPAFVDVTLADDRAALGIRACEPTRVKAFRYHEHAIGAALRAANCHVTSILIIHPVSPEGLSACDSTSNRAGGETHAGPLGPGVGACDFCADVTAGCDMADAIAGAKC